VGGDLRPPGRPHERGNGARAASQRRSYASGGRIFRTAGAIGFHGPKQRSRVRADEKIRGDQRTNGPGRRQSHLWRAALYISARVFEAIENELRCTARTDGFSEQSSRREQKN